MYQSLRERNCCCTCNVHWACRVWQLDFTVCYPVLESSVYGGRLHMKVFSLIISRFCVLPPTARYRRLSTCPLSQMSSICFIAVKSIVLPVQWLPNVANTSHLSSLYIPSPVYTCHHLCISICTSITSYSLLFFSRAALAFPYPLT